MKEEGEDTMCDKVREKTKKKPEALQPFPLLRAPLLDVIPFYIHACLIADEDVSI